MRMEKLLVQVYTPYIRRGVLGMAARLARDAYKWYRRARRELVCAAWIRMAECQEGWTEDAYLKAAFSAMYQYYDEHIRKEDYVPRKPSDDKAARRVRRFFLKNLQKSGGERAVSPVHVYVGRN